MAELWLSLCEESAMSVRYIIAIATWAYQQIKCPQNALVDQLTDANKLTNRGDIIALLGSCRGDVRPLATFGDAVLLTGRGMELGLSVWRGVFLADADLEEDWEPILEKWLSLESNSNESFVRWLAR